MLRRDGGARVGGGAGHGGVRGDGRLRVAVMAVQGGEVGVAQRWQRVLLGAGVGLLLGYGLILVGAIGVGQPRLTEAVVHDSRVSRWRRRSTRAISVAGRSTIQRSGPGGGCVGQGARQDESAAQGLVALGNDGPREKVAEPCGSGVVAAGMRAEGLEGRRALDQERE